MDALIIGAALVKLKPSNCDWSIVAIKCLLPIGVSLAGSRVNSVSKLLVSAPDFYTQKYRQQHQTIVYFPRYCTQQSDSKFTTMVIGHSTSMQMIVYQLAYYHACEN